MTRQHFKAPAGGRRARGDQRGAAMVEFALVVGIFMMVLYGLIYFGMALATKQRVTNAAAEAARSAVGESAVDAPTTAANRVKSLLGEPNGRYTIGPEPTGPRLGNCDSDPLLPPATGSQCITVKITWHWDTHPVVPAAPGLGLVPVDSLGSEAVVQYAG